MPNKAGSRLGERLTTDTIYREIIGADFLGMDIPGLKTVLESVNHRFYDENSVIFHEGEEIASLYIIRTGRVKLIHYLDNGSARIVRLHNKGSILGLNGLLDEQHEHTAMSIDPVETFEIPLSRIHLLKDKDPETYAQLLEYWNEYLHTADKWITEFSTGPIRNRIARLILYLIDHDELSGKNQTRLLTGEEMSEILGVTPESVSRTIADFKRSNIIAPLDDGLDNMYRCNIDQLQHEASS